MDWLNNTDYGHQMLIELAAAMRIDPQWTAEMKNGFAWWPSDFCQRVWCDPGVFQQATTLYRIHSEVDVIKGSGKHAAFETAAERDMDYCSLSSLVYDESADTFRLHSSVYATEENMAYLKRTSFAAVILQIREAAAIADHLRRTLNAVPAVSYHPTNGMRAHADPMMHAAEQFFMPAGKEQCRWIGAAEWRETSKAIERESESFETDGTSCLTADFPWSCGPKAVPFRLELSTNEPHPLLGNGLHATLTVPLDMPADRCSHMALDLNQYERENWKKTHMLGSWTMHAGRLAYRQFLPNQLYRPELLESIALNMAVRAYWVNEYFYQMMMSVHQHQPAQ